MSGATTAAAADEDIEEEEEAEEDDEFDEDDEEFSELELLLDVDCVLSLLPFCVDAAIICRGLQD